VEITRACDLQDIANLRSICATKFPLLPARSLTKCTAR
jgi:hypothetical protein